jgi:hypothetical protein
VHGIDAAFFIQRDILPFLDLIHGPILKCKDIYATVYEYADEEK